MVATQSFDDALVAAYAQMREEDLSTALFWSTYKDIAGLVLPTADVELIMAETSLWTKVALPLRRAVPITRRRGVLLSQIIRVH